MRHILMPVDKSSERIDRQLDTLGNLFDSQEITVDILHVHEKVDAQIDEGGFDIDETMEKNLEELQGLPSTVEQAANELLQKGIDVEVHQKRGDPVSTIISTSEEVNAETILVTNPERTPVGKVVFGSVTQGVILKAQRPVLVV